MIPKVDYNRVYLLRVYPVSSLDLLVGAFSLMNGDSLYFDLGIGGTWNYC
jgi:hypothetical protein